jgi:molybdate transport system permease protein
MALALALLLALLVLPLVALLVRVPSGVLLQRLGEPLVLDALRLSLITSLASTVLVVMLGLPAAYLFATREFRGKAVLEVVVDLPLVLPPTVAGVGLLLAFGRAGLAGGALRAVGLSLPFTTLAVVVAQTFVALPLFVGPVAAGLREVEVRYLDAAATLGATPDYAFRRVMLPLAFPALVTGAALSWARALGEFGATITFAGNLPGVTQTMPLAVYLALQSDLQAAIALSSMLLVVSFTLLFLLRRGAFAPGWRTSRAQRPRP